MQKTLRMKYVSEHKKDFLDLLLLADEEEAMIDRYLEKGQLWVAFLDRQPEVVIGVCVVTQEQPQLYEIKNLAIAPAYQQQGYGKQVVDFICRQYRGKDRFLQVGTGAGTNNVRFYEACGFTISHTIPHFFTEHYSHPIYEGAILLQDMVYLRKSISPALPT